MNLTCYVVDDEFHSIEVLLEYISKTDGLELVGSSVDPLVALNEVSAAGGPDITFVDIEMPQLSGLDFAALVNPYTKVVITTSYREYAIEAFEKEAVDYLLKPVGYQRFLQCIQHIKKDIIVRAPMKRTDRSFFFVHTEIKGKIVKVVINDIVFVEGAQNYVFIHLKTGKIMPYLTMGEMEDYLPKDKFSRIHKSFIISNDQIKFIDNGLVTLENNVHLTIGKAYKPVFLEMMKELIVKTKRKL